jgi:2-C-methyl-D-erythritol 4-phosphate cytidylyltransferase
VGTTYALLLAAGSGTRLGGRAKAFTDLGGIPMFVRAHRTVAACRDIAGVVILVPEANLEMASAVIASEGATTRAVVAVGGETRQESVRRGLEVLPEQADVVVCHDAARPFASLALLERVTARLLAGGTGVDGVVPVVASPDTVKRIRDGMVVETVRREELGLVQTPQAFRRRALEDAHRQAVRSGLLATDDAMLLESAGYRVAVVEGEQANFKITTSEDLLRAEQLLARGAMA